MAKNVEFYEEDSNETSRGKTNKTPASFSGKIMRFGWAKNEQQANVILVIITLVFFAASIFLFFLSNRISAPIPPVETPQNFIP